MLINTILSVKLHKLTKIAIQFSSNDLIVHVYSSTLIQSWIPSLIRHDSWKRDSTTKISNQKKKKSKHSWELIWINAKEMSVSSVYEQKNLSLISVRITEGMFPMVPWWQGLNNNANCGTSGTKRDLSYEISCSRLSLPELTISCPFSLVSFENSWIGQVRELLFVQVIATVCRRSSIVKCKFRLGRDCRWKQKPLFLYSCNISSSVSCCP